MENNIRFSFCDGAKVEIIGDDPAEYTITFIDKEIKSNIYSSTIKNNMWCCTTLRYYIKWWVEIKKDGIIIEKKTLDLKNRKVKIIVDTNNIRELFSVIELIKQFQRLHQCNLECIIFDVTAKTILEKCHDNIVFHVGDNTLTEYYATYKISRFIDWNGWTRNCPEGKSLEEITMDVLNLDNPAEIDEVVTILIAHANSEHRKNVLKDTLRGIKTKIILVSNCPVDEETQRLSDYVISDRENPLLRKEEYVKYGVGFHWIMTDGTTVPFEYEHSYACYKLLAVGLEFANALGYKKMHYYNYDCQLSDKTLSEDVKWLNEYDCVLYVSDSENHGEISAQPNYFSANVQKVLPFFRKYKTKFEYYRGGAGNAPCAFFDIKISTGIADLNIKVKQILNKDLLKENKIDIVRDIH